VVSSDTLTFGLRLVKVTSEVKQLVRNVLLADYATLNSRLLSCVCFLFDSSIRDQNYFYAIKNKVNSENIYYQ
jgi:hypothetical protein